MIQRHMDIFKANVFFKGTVIPDPTEHVSRSIFVLVLFMTLLLDANC